MDGPAAMEYVDWPSMHGGTTARGGVTSRSLSGGGSLSARGGRYCGYATARSNGAGGQLSDQYVRRPGAGPMTTRSCGGSTARGAPTPRGTLLEPDFVIAARAATAPEQRLRPLPAGMPDPMPLPSSPQYTQGMLPPSPYYGGFGAQTARLPPGYGGGTCGIQ